MSSSSKTPNPEDALLIGFRMANPRTFLIRALGRPIVDTSMKIHQEKKIICMGENSLLICR